MSTPRECSLGGEKIDPWPRKRKISDANFSATVLRALQLNIEGLSVSRICDIEQLTNRRKALINLLQETHCANMDRLMIPNFTLASSLRVSLNAFEFFSARNISDLSLV